MSPPVPSPTLTVCLLASGSRGNAIYVSDGETSLLVDAGLSGKEIEARLRSKGLDPRDLDAILVSHEHVDHVRGVGILSRRYRLPVYLNPRTAAAAAPIVGKLHQEIPVACGEAFRINSLAVHPFSISHDAEDPAGFTIARNGTKIGIATDLGIATTMVRTHLSGCALLVLEANHDPDMLLNGPYPWPLKQRVRGRSGHLSNPETRDLLKELLHQGLSQVVLAHLSETNNTPELAAGEVGLALQNHGARLHVGTQDACTDLIRMDITPIPQTETSHGGSP